MAELTLEDLFGDFSPEEFSRRLDESLTARQLRLSHPYVLDLIAVLLPHPSGLRRPDVLRRIRDDRKSRGHKLPANFEEAVQSSLQQHCADSAVFRKRRVAETEALFYWPRGARAGFWAVHADRAKAWLQKHGAQ